MPRVFDNIEQDLLPALQNSLGAAERADFCVGYFNLRGWRHVADHVGQFTGEREQRCRLLIGMQVAASEELRQLLRTGGDPETLDNQTAVRERRRIAEDFRRQLTFGVPSNQDEETLRKLSLQIREGKLAVKVFLRHTLHAKLYLAYRNDADNPITAYLGSSNLTLAGLSHQGELNVDVVDSDATTRLKAWFQSRWEDRWCLDISSELAEIIDESWAGEDLVPPYHVFLKMAYHLAQEARTGLTEFRIPKEFGDMLFDFQIAAVKIAAHHLHKRGGVLIGDVVGLGKSLMATALAKIFEDDFEMETLIICPANLVSMWEDYAHEYRLRATVMSVAMVITELPERMRRHRIVLIDESHNLRNKEGKRWRAIREYIERNESLCILLSATPYNKSYLDLSAQLGLFLHEDLDLGIRPENLISELGGEHRFIARHQCPVRSISAFEKSEHPDDWRELMRLYMVRRTRGFIVRNYAQEDERGKYLEFSDGRRSYFPARVPRTVPLDIRDGDTNEPYARFLDDTVIDSINSLVLPRYGLGNYIQPDATSTSGADVSDIIDGLSRAGTRLMGFCRTNLFKRLESAGPSFLSSLERHILRNFIVLHALETDQPIPLGAQGAEHLDSRFSDEDTDNPFFEAQSSQDDLEDGAFSARVTGELLQPVTEESEFRARAGQIYKLFHDKLPNRFKWLPSSLFGQALAEDLMQDSRRLIEVLEHCGAWDPTHDTKLNELVRLIEETHPDDKLLVFTQFADTARYLEKQLKIRGIRRLGLAVGGSDDPTEMAWRFSPVSNDKRNRVAPEDELRVLIATDVLSEGQNLQDCAIIVNYDLPWAIIRLIQRAGRVDRIGQQAERILCYSFLPAEGVEKLIRLRERVRQRLEENAEVVGADETFFNEPDEDSRVILDLYNERSGVLDDEEDEEVDLASYAWQIWKNATDADPSLIRKIESLPDAVYATKHRDPARPGGVLVYSRTAQGNDALAWVDEHGRPVTQSQLTILKAAACSSDTKPLERMDNHHELAAGAVEHLVEEEKSFGGSLGRPSGARFRTYERLRNHREHLGDQRDLLITDEYVRRLDRTIEEIYRYPLRKGATDALNRHLKSGIEGETLAQLVLDLREDGQLCVIDDELEQRDPKLICSMGLA